MYYFFTITLSALSAVLISVMSFKLFQILQQSSYRVRGLFNWLKITKLDYIVRYFSAAFFSFAAMALYVLCFRNYKVASQFGIIFFVAICMLFILLTVRQKSKLPLKFTARIVRFCVIDFILNALLSYLLLYLGLKTPLSYAFIGIMPLLAPITAVCAHFIILPFELLNNFGYLTRAKKKLASMPALIRIGITGSYGKTTAKNILAAMLQSKYRVCFSPSSYNTPMGISKVVNNDLDMQDRIFIAEMGARNRGDIAELAKIVTPNYGLITSIGNQHLETFGDRQTIINTKYELIENLAPGGYALFNGDSPDTVALYEKTTGAKSIVGQEGTPGADNYYKDIHITTSGTEFTLVLDGTELRIVTKLLGKHIPSLIALCAVCAARLGVSQSEIADSVSKLESVPHRLQLIRSGNNYIIDDAYNSNCEGAKNALLILKEFAEFSRVVITPGLVELGQEEKEANVQLGREIAECADSCYLIGARAQFIRIGALEKGMTEENIIICDSPDAAVKLLSEKPGEKAILFENDLPDNL